MFYRMIVVAIACLLPASAQAGNPIPNLVDAMPELVAVDAWGGGIWGQEICINGVCPVPVQTPIPRMVEELPAPVVIAEELPAPMAVEVVAASEVVCVHQGHVVHGTGYFGAHRRWWLGKAVGVQSPGARRAHRMANRARMWGW